MGLSHGSPVLHNSLKSEYIGRELHLGKQVDVIYLDMS